MLTAKECFDYSDLSEAEIDAIAEHEHVPPMVAAELGKCLLQSDMGTFMIRRYIEEDLQRAQLRKQDEHAAELNSVLQQFEHAHPTYVFRS